MDNKRIITLFIGIIFVLSFATFSVITSQALAASKSKPIELKFGYFMPPKTPFVEEAVEPWAKQVEEATNGRVKIVHYPAQSLFKARDALTAVENGLADIVHTPLGYFTGRFNLTEVMFLPFLLDSPSPMVNSRIAQKLYDTTPAIQKEFANMKLLFIYSTDLYLIASNKKPFRNRDDLKGMKIRTIGKYPTKVMKALGATPVMVPLPGLYEAAAKGVVDGGLILRPMLPDFKLQEVFNYWTDVRLWPSLVIHAMNLDKWNSLPPDVQEAIMSVNGISGAEFMAKKGFGPYLTNYLSSITTTQGQKWERVELDEGEYTNWKNTVGKPLWNEWVKEMEKKGLPGQMVLDNALKLIKENK